MRRISRADFVSEFPVTIPGAKMGGINEQPVELDRDVYISGIFGEVTILGGANVLLNGIVKGPVVVERGAILYATGIIKGKVTVRGAACLDGIVEGALDADEGATVSVDGIVKG
jgi:hypothetical protein